MEQLSRDGVALAYTECGQGGPPLLFVHGWSSDHTYWDAQVQRFSGTHRVIVVDLRGHGQSDHPESGYSMEVFADDLAWLCGQLRAEQPVVIGHSMGGLVGLALAARYPSLAAAVVAVDAPILVPAALGQAMGGLGAALRTPAYLEAAEQFAGLLFMPGDPEELKHRVSETLRTMTQQAMASAWEGMGAFDSAAAAAGCAVPMLYIVADGPGWPLSDLARFKALCPHLRIGQTVGAGHFPQVVVPEQVNAMIERFVALDVRLPAAV